MKHATVKIGNYTVPLIGIPESAVEDKCDGCGKTFHISDLQLTDNKMLCNECRQKPKTDSP